MTDFLSTLTLAPILRGFVAMILSGASFPLCGVMVLRLQLVPMRYMLMHGVILGGALSLALSLPILPVTAAVNLILVFLLIALSKDESQDFGVGSAAAMAISMALASLVIHKAGVTANNTLNLLWGSPFALQNSDLLVLSILSLGLVTYVLVNFKSIIAVFYNKEVARSLGINVRLHYLIMVTLIALVIAVAMKILGALLIDSLLILPVIISSKLIALKKNGTGMKRLFIISSISGCVISIAGFVAAVVFDLPPSAAVSLTAGVLYVCLSIGAKK